MAKITNVPVKIEGENIGSMIAVVDLLINNEIGEENHPDNPTPSYVISVEILKIHSVELQVFDKVGIDLTGRMLRDRELKAILETKICDEVEYAGIDNLLKDAA